MARLLTSLYFGRVLRSELFSSVSEGEERRGEGEEEA
jgi:hypothetical protein